MLYGLGEGIVFGKVLAMVAGLMKKKSTGKSFAIFWSCELFRIALEIALDQEELHKKGPYITGIFRLAFPVCYALSVVLFLLV